jgi:peroxiredoxin Q/BCP
MQHWKFITWLVIGLSILVGLAGCQATPSGLQVGDTAPDFELPATDGATVRMADYAGKQPVLLYFHMAVG